jgi:hypothetical protein
MDIQDLQFWEREAARMRNERKADLAETARFAQADDRQFGRYFSSLSALPESRSAPTKADHKAAWEVLKAKKRG